MSAELDFFDEVVVVHTDEDPGLDGAVGAVLGKSEFADTEGRHSYGVYLDSTQTVVMFRRDQLTPTGRRRERRDYYEE